MPPKAPSSNNSSESLRPTKAQLEVINNYLAQKPDFDKFITAAKANPQPPTPKVGSEYEKILRAAVKATLEERRKEAEASRSQELNMPVHPKEEQAESNLYDKIAKDSKDSAASSHPLHYSETGKSSIDHHKATPGPVMAENLPEAASKEELRMRMEELNKKK